MQCDFISYHSGRRFEETLEVDSEEKSNKCNQCDYTSSCAYNLRTHLRTHSALQCGEVKQMQPMWLCLFSGRQFEEKIQTNATNVTMHICRCKQFENTQWRKARHKCNRCDFASSWAKLWIWIGIFTQLWYIKCCRFNWILKTLPEAQRTQGIDFLTWVISPAK